MHIVKTAIAAAVLVTMSVGARAQQIEAVRWGVFAVCLQTSFLPPPVGFSLFYLKGVARKEIATRHIYAGIIPFLVLQLLAVAASFM